MRTALRSLLYPLACATGLFAANDAMPLAEPLPGQIIIDREHPEWLKRQGGGHVFVCGPGDPEGFLYRGTRNPNGTRAGDQVELIDKLIHHGGNCLYMQMVRTHGGDAGADTTHNPFIDSDPSRGLDERILTQWGEWFARMDRNGILIYLFFYDDGARIWDTGERVGPEEQAFFEAIVRRFRHHRNLIWIIGEETEEKYTHARVNSLAEIIRRNDHAGRVIGSHHLNGVKFKAWRPGSALNHFSMQYYSHGDEVHLGAIAARREAAGRYQVIFAENTAHGGDIDGWRAQAWSAAMGGTMPMLLLMDIANTPVEALAQCRYLQQFFEATDFYRLNPHDELRHADTKFVLAEPGRSYIAYANQLTGELGLAGLPAGRCEVSWLDCRSGATATATHTFRTAGRQVFTGEGTRRFRGMELGYRHHLSFLPGFLSGTSVFGTYTRTYADQRRPGLVPNLVTGGIDYAHRRFSFGIRGVWQDETPWGTVNTIRFRKNNVKFDGNLGFRLTSRTTLFVQARNILNENSELFEEGMLWRLENFGSQWMFGVRGEF